MASSFMTDSPFLNASAGRPGHAPVWFMRQAGRSLPEYRELAAVGRFLMPSPSPNSLPRSRCNRFVGTTLMPQCCSVTLLYLYRDRVRYRCHTRNWAGCGATISHRDDLQRLPPLTPEHVQHVTETVDILVNELPASVPLLAFAGAVHRCELSHRGCSSRTYQHTKAMMHAEPRLWHDLMECLSVTPSSSFQLNSPMVPAPFNSSTRGQGRFQLLTTTPSLHPTRHGCSHIKRAHADVPGIHFGIGCDHLLESMCAAGPQILGLDWRTRISSVCERMGSDLVVQGNLDPSLVLAGMNGARWCNGGASRQWWSSRPHLQPRARCPARY